MGESKSDSVFICKDYKLKVDIIIKSMKGDCIRKEIITKNEMKNTQIY